jgi:hypothetical protein
MTRAYRSRSLLGALLAFGGLGALPALAADTTFEWESDAAGWVTPTAGATVTVARKAEEAHGGSGCLAFAYEGKQGDLAAVVSPELSLDGVTAIDGWVKSSKQSILTLVAAEKDGSRYEQTFTTVPGRWQRLRASLAEMQLAEDSEDDNSTLDVGQIQNISLVDAGLLLAGVPGLSQLFPQSGGARTLWLDDFRLVRDAAPARHPDERVVVVDSFEEGVVRGLPLVGARIEVDRIEGAGVLHLIYTPRDQALDIPGVILLVSGAHFNGTERVRLRARSQQSTKIAVGIEEKDGSRYNAVADLAGGAEWQRLEIPLSSLTLAEDTTDENDRLDITQAKTVAIVDVSRFLGAPLERENRITLDEVLLVGKGSPAGK